MKQLLYICLTMIVFSCNSQDKKPKTSEVVNSTKTKEASQIGQYVTSVFEDSKKHLWFGTIEKGISKYDGNTFKYYTKQDGLPTNRVTGVIEDANNNYWFSTDKRFTEI